MFDDKKLDALAHQIQLPTLNSDMDTYTALLEAIASQQLSVKVADIIFGRFLDLFPNRYPDASLLLQKSFEEIKAVGFSKQKTTYIQNIATFHLEKGIYVATLNKMNDTQIIDYLTTIKGVGRWTVEMLLIFTLHRPDVFPLADLGIQQAMMRLYDLEKDKDLHKKMAEIANHWTPNRSLASRYLWKWKDTEKLSKLS